MERLFRFFSLALILVVGLGTASNVTAQVDPTSTILLKSRGQASREGGGGSGNSDFGSSRYTVKPGPATTLPPKTTPSQSSDESQKPSSPQVVVVPNSNASGSTDSSTSPSPATGGETLPAQDLGSQMKHLLLDKPNPSMEKFRRSLQPEDVRKNLLEISLAPTYIYNDSSSASWFRDYYTAGPGLHVNAKFWITPFFGIQSTYLTSFGTEMRGNRQGTKYIAIDHQYYDVGLRSRRFFGSSRRSSVLSFGIDFRDYSLNVPSDETQRVRLETSGVRLSVELGMPSKKRGTWVTGVEFVPRAQHKEIKTELKLKSGRDNETNIIGLWVGKNYFLNRKNQIFWKVSHSIEKTVFEGAANQADPLSGNVLTGVGVTNNTTLFQFGYTWGD